MTDRFSGAPYGYDERPVHLLRRMIGPHATFRDGQREAIDALTNDLARLLVVQRTGWGKSAVYFIATKMFREQSYGPTLLISPLLALMRNQIAMAERLGLRAATINSSNTSDWDDIERQLELDEIDLLLVSPERLANDRFRSRTLPSMPRGIGMFVVDEAHCISDWGHDFRPDYRRIVGILENLPSTMPVLATTATANARVVADIADQLGSGLRIVRGTLARESLRLQAIRLDHQSERLAWMAERIPHLSSSGIVYCLTVADTERVAGWLQANEIAARAYSSAIPNDERVMLEGQLLRNEIKVLVATVALGMGFDKPDLGFVIHYQRPGSVVAYYQQVGRAGRSGQDSFAIVLNGTEDDDIQDYFIRTAFPTAEETSQVLGAIEASEEGLDRGGILSAVNMSQGRVDASLKHLEVDGLVVRDGRAYVRTANPNRPDSGRAEGISALRYRDLNRMQVFVLGESCLMEFVARELDDPTARPCGRCAWCCGALLPTTTDERRVRAAVSFLKRDLRMIEPRKQFPAGFRDGASVAPIRHDERLEPGFALSVYGDAGWGRLVRDGKQRTGRFDDELVDALAEAILDRRRPEPFPEWVTAVPSAKRPTLVSDLASRLAARLGLPFRQALVRAAPADSQKTMQNSLHQATNADRSIEVDVVHVLPGRVLLVDDFVDSRWTMTIAGMKLRQAGSGTVVPVALGSMVGAGSG